MAQTARNVPAGPAPTAAGVAAYLRAHPSFLADRLDLYRALTPPRRVHGEALADHMAAMLEAERAHGRDMAAQADGVLAAGRAAAGLAGRVQGAVLALIAADSVFECVTSELPAVLAIDSVSLCSEADLPGARKLPEGTVEALLGGRGGIFRPAPTDAALLHGEAAALARVDALVRVPLAGAPALLALGARDGAALDPAQGLGALVFLGRVIAAALLR